MSGSLESVQWNACVHRLNLGLYSHPKEFWGNGVRTHANSMGKIISTGKILPRGGLNPQCCIKQDSKPNTLPISYSSRLLEYNLGPYKLQQIKANMSDGSLRRADFNPLKYISNTETTSYIVSYPVMKSSL